MNATDLLGGGLCLVAALALVLRQIVLSPSMGSWPDAGPAVRSAMFVLAMVFAGRGIELLWLGSHRAASGLTGLGLLALATVALYHVVMAANVLRQVLPPNVWDRLKRVNGLAFCPPRGRLALLALAGVRVLPPDADGEALIDEADPSARRSPPAPRWRGLRKTGFGRL